MLPLTKGIEALQVASAMILTWVQSYGLLQVRAPPEHRMQVADPRALDWHLLPCTVLFFEVFNNLPGYLSWNTHETAPLQDLTRAHVSSFISQVFPGTPDWSEGKILCRPCVLKLMARHALNFLRENKAQRRSRLLSRGVWE